MENEDIVAYQVIEDTLILGQNVENFEVLTVVQDFGLSLHSIFSSFTTSIFNQYYHHC